MPPARSAPAKKSLARLGPGKVARLLASDPMAAIDVPHFCAEAGHDLIRCAEAADHHEFLIRKRA